MSEPKGGSFASAHLVLLVDIGNSRVKWAWARGESLQGGEPFPRSSTVEQEFDRCWGESIPPVQLMVSNVGGGEIGAALQAWAQRRWGLAPRFVCSQAAACGVVNGYEHPDKLGVDRWMALIGARHAWPGAVCVADCGTAITVDALDADGLHLGGLIAPGLALMGRALVQGTCGLPSEQAQGGDLLARNTAEAMQSGAIQAAAGLIERTLRETSRRLGLKPRLLLTGGDAGSIAAQLEIPYELRPDLVLEGLLFLTWSEA